MKTSAVGLHNEQRLVVLQPGKYLMADKNQFMKLEETKTGLLVDQIGTSYKLVLIDDKLIIL